MKFNDFYIVLIGFESQGESTYLFCKSTSQSQLFFQGTCRSRCTRRRILHVTSDRMNYDCTFMCSLHPSPLTYEKNKTKLANPKFFSIVLFHYSNACLVLIFTNYFLNNAKNALC